MTSYIVAATPRTGSTLLCEGLVASRVAGNPQEVFEPMWEAEWRAEVGVSVDESYGHFIQAAKCYGTRGDVYGVKIQWMQVAPLARNSGFRGRPEDVLEHLFPGALFVNIVRRDRLAQSLSWFRAQKTNEWWQRWPGAPPVKPPSLDPDRVRALMVGIDRQQSEWLRYFHQRGISALTVQYEDLVSDYRGQIGRVLAFLGSDPAAAAVIPDPPLIRQADDVTNRWRSAMQRAPAAASGTSGNGVDRMSALPARRSIVVLDNFYRRPDVVREYALRQRFYLPYQEKADVAAGRKTATWWASSFRSAKSCPFKSSEALRMVLEKAVGEPIDMEHWDGDYPVDDDGRPTAPHGMSPKTCVWNCCFHVKLDNGQRLGDGVHNHTIVDGWNAVGENGWVGIVYLDPAAPLTGGLNLWRNRDPSRRYDWMTPATNWELIDQFGNVFNRLVLVRGNIPHSGAAGWGDRIENGRLYQTFFFKTIVHEATWSVSVPEIEA